MMEFVVLSSFSPVVSISTYLNAITWNLKPSIFRDSTNSSMRFLLALIFYGFLLKSGIEATQGENARKN